MTLTKQKKPGQVNPSNNREPLVKPSVQQMMEKGEESQLTNQGQDQAQMKSDSFGTPAFNQPNSTVQARLKMGKPNDPYEKEADKVADKVVQNPDAKSAKPNIQQVQLSPSPEAGNDIIQRSESEDEFKVFREHRLKMYDQQIAAIPEGPDKEKAVKKLTKEKEKFEKKATGFSSKMTKKGGWEDEGYEEKRDKKFGADYNTTIEDKKAIVKKEITATVSSITSSIKASTELMTNAITAADKNSGLADKLLKDAERVLVKTKETSKNIAATFTKGGDDQRILNELDAIIKKLITLVDTIRKNRDGLLADKPTFLAVISNLGAQQTILDKFTEKVNNEESVVKLIAIQETELPALKSSIDASIAAANGTNPATTLIDETSTTASIDGLESDTEKQLKDPKIVERIDKFKKKNGAEASWPLSAKIKRDLKGWTDKDRFKMVVAMVRAAPVSERQKAVRNSDVLDAIKSSLSSIEGASVVSELLVGSQKWTNPTGNDFYNHFVVNRKSGPIKTKDSMNCWESIMYSAHLSGHLSASWIRDFYTKSGAGAGVNFDPAIVLPKLWAKLGFTTALPTYNPGKGNVPVVGQLVFYHPSGSAVPSHVAVYVGNNEVISLWTKPNKSDSVQRIPITSIGGTIYYSDSPW
jgi:hypothetical protein